jgi:hypothetical protein
MRETQDEFDSLLDSALSTYADPGADSGLEQRILVRITAEEAAAPRHHWLSWAVVLPAAACLLLAIVLAGRGLIHVHAPAGHQQEVCRAQRPAIATAHRPPQPAVRPAPVQRVAAPAHKLRPHRAVLAAESAPLPKREIFPTPQPLSPGEQALAYFATHATLAERESLLTAEERANAPILFPNLHIGSLEPPAKGIND